MREIQLQVERTDQQRKAWRALDNPAIRRLLYGGAKGGGKSYFLCTWLFTAVWTIMVQAQLQPSKNPPHVAWFGRKQATDLTGTTLQTWREVIPEEYYQLRGGTERDPKHILIAGRIAIDYGGLDKQENINKFNSAEYIIIAIDQAEEVSRDDVSVLRGSLRMVLKDPKGKPLKIPFKELYTANPRQCWLKDDFITKPKSNACFVPALPSDNPYLPDDYEVTLREAFEHRPELLQAYLYGDWDSFEGAEQIIRDSWLRAAMARIAKQPVEKVYLVCDTARFGDDETVIFLMHNAEIAEQVIMPDCTAPEITRTLARMSSQNDDCTIVIETVGSDVGASVYDYLLEEKKHVINYTPQGKSMKPEKYYNVRAEAWSEAAKILQRGTFDDVTHCPVCITNKDGESSMDEKTRSQLCTPEYKFRGGKILVEAKADIKDRLGKSPDRADAYVMALWAWRRINARPTEMVYSRRNSRRQRAASPMAF